MDALAYAVAIAAANAAAAAPPAGGSDLAHYQGQILTWDESTGLNSVWVNGAAVSNMRVLQAGIGLQYQPGDTVMVEKRMSQWYILGKVAAPGGNNANQIKSDLVAAFESTASTSYGDLATFGPSVTVNVGSSRRCLVLFGAEITALAQPSTPTGIYIGGGATPAVTGASNIPAVPGNSQYAGSRFWYATASAPVGGIIVVSRMTLFTAADGLNVGSNTFTLKYRSFVADPSTGFAGRTLAVIPF